MIFCLELWPAYVSLSQLFGYPPSTLNPAYFTPIVKARFSENFSSNYKPSPIVSQASSASPLQYDFHVTILKHEKLEEAQ